MPGVLVPAPLTGGIGHSSFCFFFFFCKKKKKAGLGGSPDLCYNRVSILGACPDGAGLGVPVSAWMGGRAVWLCALALLGVYFLLLERTSQGESK